MISAIIFDENNEELNSLVSVLKDILALKVEERSSFTPCNDILSLKKAIRNLELDDFSCFSFLPEDGAKPVYELRNKFPDSPLLIIVDNKVSPACYIRPGIMASSILLRPYDYQEMRTVVDEFITAFLENSRKENEKTIKIETKDGITLIPTEKIYYIEASSKKIYIRLKREDYGYYDTLDNLENELPEYFARCHRSYIVNMKKVKKFVGSENMLNLECDLQVPISRSYKPRIRELMQ